MNKMDYNLYSISQNVCHVYFMCARAVNTGGKSSLTLSAIADVRLQCSIVDMSSDSADFISLDVNSEHTALLTDKIVSKA